MRLDGAQFGDFRIIRELGKGGMGVVFEAESMIDGRLVALKVLPGTEHDEATRKRFLREGQLASKLKPSNTVFVFGTHDFDGTLAISMELVPGGNLDSLVSASGPMPVVTAVAAIHDIINGLEAAHQLGIIHRDVKPSNCFIAIDGSIKLGDFGLSRTIREDGNGRVTTTGVVLASPAFAPPEQLLGEPLDLRSDIYAIGATLYYLLTAKLPYPGKEPMHVLAAVMQGAPTLIDLHRRGLPAALVRVVARCLAREASGRFEGYESLRRALAEAAPPMRQPAGVPARVLSFTIDLLTISAPLLVLPTKEEIRTASGTAIPVMIWTLMIVGLGHRVFGATVGMMVANIRVIGRDGSRVGALRGTFRFYAAVWGVSEVVIRAKAIASGFPFVEAIPVLIAWTPLVPLAITRRFTQGLAGPHDLLFRTEVVRAGAALERVASSSTEAAFAVRSVNPRVVGRFELQTEAFTLPDGSAVFHALDQVMRRPVLLHCVADGTPRVSDSRRMTARPGRARWIAGNRTVEESYDAYAVPAGVRLVDLERAAGWSACRSWLSLLANDLVQSEVDQRASPLDVHDVWLTARGQALWLDFAMPGREALPDNVREVGPLLVDVMARATLPSSSKTTPFPLVPDLSADSADG